MLPEDVAKVLEKRGLPQNGCIPKALSCAHCDADDTLDLSAKRVWKTKRFSQFSTGGAGYDVIEQTGYSEAEINHWIDKHELCAERAELAKRPGWRE